MTSLLIINSSLHGEAGNSSVLTQRFAEAVAVDDGINVGKRDVTDALGHLSAEEMGAWMTPAEERTDSQAALAQVSDDLIAEVQAADVIVLGVPMYNFGVPSNLKAWIDRVARAGITFKYSETGPVGLLKGKQVVVLAARGGAYAGTPMDTQTDYLKNFFAFLGLTDVSFVYAEGLAMGDESKAASLASAFAEIDAHATALLQSKRSAA